MKICASVLVRLDRAGQTGRGPATPLIGSTPRLRRSPAIGQHLVLMVAAAIDTGDAHPQFAAGVGAVGFRQHAVQQVPDLRCAGSPGSTS